MANADISGNLLVGKANQFVKANEIVSNPTSLGDVMNNVAIRITRRVIESLDESEHLDTGELRQSVRMPITVFNTTYIAHLYLADYYDFVNKGVSGFRVERPNTPYSYKDKNPPFPSVEKLSGWAQRHGINVFALRQSLFRKGTKGSHYYDNAEQDWLIGNIYQQFVSEIKEAGVDAILDGIKEIFKKGTKT